MPKYADRFSGHMETDDPRTPLHGAAGCTWPTVPATRYLLKSDDATGVFLPLNFLGARVIRMVNTLDHDSYSFVPLAGPPTFTILLCRKVANKATGGYRWELDLDGFSGCGVLEIRVEFPAGKCNKTVPLGNWVCPLFPLAGSTGSTFRMLQIEYDQTDPP